LKIYFLLISALLLFGCTSEKISQSNFCSDLVMYVEDSCEVEGMTVSHAPSGCVYIKGNERVLDVAYFMNTERFDELNVLYESKNVTLENPDVGDGSFGVRNYETSMGVETNLVVFKSKGRTFALASAANGINTCKYSELSGLGDKITENLE